ncbi:MAG TPA: proline--tRNA ligase, partial [Firmicutes bacterium]|nr:proline--tRNA ligase [Bacillota bacterium]
APPEELAEVFGLPVGYVGPVNLDERIKILADNLVKEMHDVVVGANEAEFHLIHVEPTRDFKNVSYMDLRTAKAGEVCPHCNGHLKEVRGIEAGQIFKLGIKYSKALGAAYLDEKGQSQLMVMGCYGIGVSRTMAAAIEQNYDKNGIKWPMAIAPYQVHIVAVNPEQLPVAEELYQKMNDAKIEVLLDDRDERPGVKFKDADLIGIPLRITLGPKSLAQGEAEVKNRQTGVEERWPLDQVVTKAVAFIEKSLVENN